MLPCCPPTSFDWYPPPPVPDLVTAPELSILLDCEVEKEELTGKMNRLQAEISSKRTQLDNLATR